MGESSSTVELQIGGVATPELVWWSWSPPKHALSMAAMHEVGWWEEHSGKLTMENRVEEQTRGWGEERTNPLNLNLMDGIILLMKMKKIFTEKINLFLCEFRWCMRFDCHTRTRNRTLWITCAKVKLKKQVHSCSSTYIFVNSQSSFA
jgi:hypothetical protein